MIIPAIFLIFGAILGLLSLFQPIYFEEKHSKELIKSIYGYARVFGYLPDANLFEQIGIAQTFFSQIYQYEPNYEFTSQTLIAFDAPETYISHNEPTISKIFNQHVATIKSKYILLNISQKTLLNQKDYTPEWHDNYWNTLDHPIPNYKAVIYYNYL